ncbi:hypothetical protein [Sporosarcina sp. P17b]|uniref:hypothetical protein n=1 Tax=Sporosarcina sp. P17b TaxID=2048260 RepID=UPI000C170813|nr:hypothetical protein [Sporosarcina sp. P17b]PIC73716.1 hypothetical protein CSV76_07290 [Sporosarcina sp. P17b]
MAFKQVYFHQLSIYRRIDKKGTKEGDYNKDYLNNELIDKKIEQFFKKVLNEHKCVKINNSNETLEIIREDKDFIFARLGKAQDIRQYHLRDLETLKADPIQKNYTQVLENFTYILINRETYIVSYLKEQSSPSIQLLGDLITSGFKDEDLVGEISSITVEDALPILSKKDRIGTVSYRVSLPPEGSQYFTQEVTGLSEKEYDMLSNQKSIEFEIKLVAETNQDAFENRKSFTAVIGKLAKKAKRVKVKAKDDGEYLQEYNIVNSPFTKKTKFELENTDTNKIHIEILTKLKEIYFREETEILKFCRV